MTSAVQRFPTRLKRMGPRGRTWAASGCRNRGLHTLALTYRANYMAIRTGDAAPPPTRYVRAAQYFSLARSAFSTAAIWASVAGN